MTTRVLRIGVSGLGRGFMLTAPSFRADPRVQVTAAADPRDVARARFEADFGGRAYSGFESLCADPQVDAIYIAAPHQFHAAQAIAAARAGKHVLVEKPMTLALPAAAAMARAVREAGVHLVVGPSHGFDRPVSLAAELIGSGDFGAVRMITALNFTDFLYRPRRPEELDPEQGGGVVFSQAAHQVDVVRRLADRRIVSVRAQTGDWDPERRSEGAYAAFLTFEGGAVAQLTYSGYGRYDSDALMGWVGETGYAKSPGTYGLARRRLAEAVSEAQLKDARAYGVAEEPSAPPAFHEHFGLVIASCERADVQPTTDGVTVHADRQRTTHDLPAPDVPRAGVIDELYAAAVEGVAPRHDAAWGLENLQVCLALRASSATRREIAITPFEETP